MRPLPCPCIAAGVFALVLLFAAFGPVSAPRAQDGLPPEVQFDVLRLEILEAARRERHKDVLMIADRMRKTGQPMPLATTYLEARAFYGLGALAMARRTLATYLKEAGRKGKDYDDAIKLFVRIKTEMDDKAREADAALRIRADFESVRAAWVSEKKGLESWKQRAVVFGGPGDDSAAAIARTGDGGIVLVGSFHLRRTGGDKPVDATLPWITAFDHAGRRVWHRPLGTANDPGGLRSVVAVPGRGYLFGGAQKGFQIAAMTDPLGNMVGNADGDPWIIAFAPVAAAVQPPVLKSAAPGAAAAQPPSSRSAAPGAAAAQPPSSRSAAPGAAAGEGGIARLLNSGDIIALGAEEIGKDAATGKAGARLPVVVRLSPKGKALGKAVLMRGGATRWYDVRDALVLDDGDVVVAGEARRVMPHGTHSPDADATGAEGYLIRITPQGKEVWSRRIVSDRGQGMAVTALAAAGGGIIAVGRDGDALSYLKYAHDGKLAWRRTRDAPGPPAAHARLCAATDLTRLLTMAYRDKALAKAAAQYDPVADLVAVRAYACRAGKPFAGATAITERPGGFVIFGVLGRDGEAATRITMTAIDDAGEVVWETTHGDGPTNVATGALATGDGGFVVAGITTNWGRDVVLFKTDASGELIPFSGLAPAAKPTPPQPPVAKTEPAPEPTPPAVKKDNAPAASGDGEEPADDDAPAAAGDKPASAGAQKREAAATDKTTAATAKNPAAPQAAPSGDSDIGLFDLFDGMFGGPSKPKP